jgi:hypothetical protein
LCLLLPTIQTGCLGCASGKNAGPRNIFGNKYGQNLAAVQIAREQRKRIKEQREQERQQALALQQARSTNSNDNQHDSAHGGGVQADEGGAETDDDDDEDDYGPTPSAGIWAGSKKLEHESELIADPDDDAETDDSGDERPSKKVRVDD